MTTEREQRLEAIIMQLSMEVIWGSDEDFWKQFDISYEEAMTILSIRYLNPRECVPKSRDWYMRILPKYDDKRFKENLRVTREDFSRLLQVLENAQSLQGNAKMILIDVQLAITLYRFGCSGNGVSYLKVGKEFGVSDAGTILNCTNRVVKALLELEQKVICWPAEEERDKILADMEDKLPGCLGFVDGSHVPLFTAPSKDHEAYFNRKQRYSIQIQAVCDNQKKIRHLVVGNPGSVHDSRVFNNCSIGITPARFFRDREWIAADSAYRLSKHTLTPFRKNSTYRTAAERKAFNKYFSGFRVRVEQTFGILKQTFQSLKELRIRIIDDEDHQRAGEWIRACCIIYNIILPQEEVDIEEDQEDNGDNGNDPAQPDEADGERRRTELFNFVLR